MNAWGWVLLTTRPRLVEWHKVLMTQDTENIRRSRYLTACRLRIEADTVPADQTPGHEPICAICRESAD